jgi:hypothetical protein
VPDGVPNLAQTRHTRPARPYREILPTTGWCTKTTASNLSPSDPPPNTFQSSPEAFDTVGVQLPLPNLFRV